MELTCPEPLTSPEQQYFASVDAAVAWFERNTSLLKGLAQRAAPNKQFQGNLATIALLTKAYKRDEFSFPPVSTTATQVLRNPDPRKPGGIGQFFVGDNEDPINALKYFTPDASFFGGSEGLAHDPWYQQFTARIAGVWAVANGIEAGITSTSDFQGLKRPEHFSPMFTNGMSADQRSRAIAVYEQRRREVNVPRIAAARALYQMGEYDRRDRVLPLLAEMKDIYTVGRDYVQLINARVQVLPSPGHQ